LRVLLGAYEEGSDSALHDLSASGRRYMARGWFLLAVSALSWRWEDLVTAGPDFDGVTYSPTRDKGRLQKQLSAVKDTMLRYGGWWSLETLAAYCGAPQASVSARLRDLRKPKFGGYSVEREYRGGGLWAYKLSRPKAQSHG
jgi:hypothetical protein